MGLDINFWRLKKAAYDQYNQDTENWEENIKPKDITWDEYEKLPEKEREAYDEANRQRPDFSDYAEEIGYFRKVNFLVSFFNYEENCSLQEITYEEVKWLKTACETVLGAYKESEEWRNREDASDYDYEDEPWEDVADSYLPTQEGFFFGSTDYNEYYISDVREVKEWCEKVLADTNKEEDVLIMDCWW